MENSNLESEQEAIARLKSGYLDGMEILVRRYQLQAIRAAYLVAGDRPTAEDIVQAAFLRAAERIHQFDDRRLFGPWFLRSVINDAIKVANRRNRYVSLESPGESDPWENLADPSPLPEEMAQAKETRQAMQRALDQLKPQERAVIVMRYYLEMDQAEMSARLGSPVGTVKWLLHSARERLRNLLGSPVDTDSSVSKSRVEQAANRNWRKR